MSEVRRFFIDKDSAANLDDGVEFCASGIVEEKYSENSASGKDYAVVFMHPFTGAVQRQWRASNDIIVYEFDDSDLMWFSWGDVKNNLEAIEKI